MHAPLCLSSFQASNLASCFKEAVLKTYRRENLNLRSAHRNSLYEQAKYAQTIQRDLWRSLQLYVQAVKCHERVDSSIKDFASVLHQLGYTQEAVHLLQDLRRCVVGSLLKYDRLIENLSNQVEPTGKHDCKSILIELGCLDTRQYTQAGLLSELFSNTARVKSVKFCADLSLQPQAHTVDTRRNYKYMVLQFQSFSAAKKTLEKFKYQEWFGLNKYWLNKECSIVCQAHDGRTDFAKEVTVNHQELRWKCVEWTREDGQDAEDIRRGLIDNVVAIELIRHKVSRISQK